MNRVRRDIINLEKNPNIPHEFEVNFDKKGIGKIILNFKRNETLVKERENIRKRLKFKQPFKNVLYLYFDTVSRAHFIRQMPETVKFIKKYLSNPKIKSKESISSFEFLKLNGLGKNTFPNNYPLFAGISKFRVHQSKGQTIGKNFKDIGYITGTMNDIMEKYTYYTFITSQDYMEKFTFGDPDHDGTTLFSDPNYYTYPSSLNGPYGIVFRCLYGKQVIEYLFDYTFAFWDAYIDQPKAFKSVNNYGHEFSMEVIRHADILYKNFLEKFKKKGYFNNTIVYILSDHGHHVMPLYRLWFEDYSYENILPFLFILG